MHRFLFLDCMRGLAVLLVMLTHFAEGRIHVIESINSYFLQTGQAGVSIFFLISGYIIPRSIASTKSIREFWVHRLFRLFPIYWCSISLACILSYFDLIRLSPNITTFDVLRNFSMLQGFLNTQNIIGVFWSLKFELIFYFLMTAIALTSLLRYSVTICLAYSCGIAIIAIWMFFVQGTYFSYGLFHIQLMLIGWVVSETQNGTCSRLQAILVIAAGVFVTVVTAFTSFYGRGDTAAGGTLTVAPMLGAWLFGLFAFLLSVLLRESAIWTNWLGWVGRVSYSAYLLHVLVLFVLAPFIRDLELIAVPLLFGVSLLFAWIGYHFVELPSIALGKRVASYWALNNKSSAIEAAK